MEQTDKSGVFSDPDLARFYDFSDRSEDDFDYVRQLASGVDSVLDLGCGTGQLATSIAHHQSVVGVDPAEAMLDIARGREGGDRVTWINADARSLRIDRRFDLVVLSGHTFQVFLSNADQLAALTTIAAHLAPHGRFIFDSRNPAFPAKKERTANESRREFHHPKYGRVEMWNESQYEAASGILTYTNSYQIHGEATVYAAKEKIRYTDRDELADRLRAAGLKATQWLGDWQGNPFHPLAREIIPIGELGDCIAR